MQAEGASRGPGSGQAAPLLPWKAPFVGRMPWGSWGLFPTVVMAYPSLAGKCQGRCYSHGAGGPDCKVVLCARVCVLIIVCACVRWQCVCGLCVFSQAALG